MKGAVRRDAIADYIQRAGYARIEEVADHFQVSRMTVHRHVEALTKQGIVRKLHGAVTAQPSGLYESAFRFRQTLAVGEKQALARAALTYVEAGQAIMLDDSSTATMLVEYLGQSTPLTVVTNSVGAAEKLHAIEDIETISLGGSYNRIYNAYVGLMCEQAISRLRVNTVFLSASAVEGVRAFIQDQQVVRIKQAMMEAAQKRILMLDHHKFDRVALHALAELSAFDAVIVSKGLDPERQEALRKANVHLQVVDWDAPASAKDSN
jgi:DeoR/GlpR family transcriptional regulator of sugar metabolism